MIIYINHFNKDICDTLEEIGYSNGCNIPLFENNKYGILLITNSRVFREFSLDKDSDLFNKYFSYCCRDNEMEFIRLAIEYYENKDFKSDNSI